MARKTHLKREEDRKETIERSFTLFLSPGMHEFLEIESKRLTEKKGKRVSPSIIVRALITAYYEKRVAGLLVDPDD